MTGITEKRAATIRAKMESSIRAALQRLESGAPEYPAFKKAIAAGKPVPITQAHVCKEAGKSRSALHRHYPALLAEIRAAAARQGRDFGPTITCRLRESAMEVRRLETAGAESASMIASLQLKVLDLETRLADEQRKAGCVAGVPQLRPLP